MTNHGETGSTTITTTPNPGNPQNGNKTTMIGNPTTKIHGTVGKNEKIDVKLTTRNQIHATNPPGKNSRTTDHAKAQDQIQPNPIQVHPNQTTLQLALIPNSEIHHSQYIPKTNPNPETSTLQTQKPQYLLHQLLLYQQIPDGSMVLSTMD